eukprot:SAG31_NODE_10580_length_1121_cov_2.326810_1_plen_26_part_10
MHAAASLVYLPSSGGRRALERGNVTR